MYGVHDGDTITVRCGEGEQIKIRFAEIDAPELRQPFGQASKQALSDLIFGKDVDIQAQTVDRYGRTVALVLVGGVPAQRLMLQSGYAWCYTRYSKQVWCAGDETVARSRKRGLWSKPHPVAPWEYRKAKKAK